MRDLELAGEYKGDLEGFVGFSGFALDSFEDGSDATIVHYLVCFMPIAGLSLANDLLEHYGAFLQWNGLNDKINTSNLVHAQLRHLQDGTLS